MKQFFLLVSLTVTVALSAFANPVETNDPLAEQAFKKLFNGASHVSWSKEEGNFLRASFLWGEHHTIAYFDQSGKMVGSIRGLFFSQLPLSVMRSFSASFDGHVVLEVREIANAEGVTYTLATEYKNKNYRIRMDSLGGLIENERIRK